MNYMVCLAHFCELHGPSTIICTQKTTLAQQSSLLLKTNSKLQTCASCKLTLPDGAVNLQSAGDNESEGAESDNSSIDTETTSKVSTDTSDPAAAAAAASDTGLAAATTPAAATASTPAFVSTQYPANSQRYSALTKLVMKSLSVETTSDLSKPIFFGDVTNGYCITKIFKISDSHARGGERKYSLMVVGDNEKDLLLHWDTVTLYLNELISLIQDQVSYVSEELIPKKTKAGAGTGTGSGASSAAFDNERYLRRSVVKPKSLIELTNDDQLFVKIHLWAIEVLKDVTS